MAIQVDGLYKRYGSKVSVNGLTFSLGERSVLGFIGPNGAGKTTTMRMICGIMPPSSGAVRIDGISMAEEPVRAKQRIGYLPENAPLHGNMTVRSFLHYCGRMRGLYGNALTQAFHTSVAQCALEDVLSDEIESLSKGFKRRVSLAQAVMHRPRVLVLDEPTDGLDPNQKREIRALIRSMRENCAIIVSTHILEEIDAVCDRVLTICHGEKVFDGSVAEFRSLSPEGRLDDVFAKLSAGGDA